MDTVFVFDMDGVLIDSVPLHYDVYRAFVRRYGVRDSREEFNRLNGKKLLEIVSHLKTAHRLSPAASELATRYDGQMRAVYAKAPLTQGMRAALRRLRRARYRVALASSATRRHIEFVLRRFKLASYFDLIVSGDDVRRAKPSPDIYEAVRTRFGAEHDYYVVEDSDHGVAAALAAGMRVIRFDPLKRRAPHPAVETVSRIQDVSTIIENGHASCRMVACHHRIEARLAPRRLSLSPQQKRASQRLWAQATARNPSLFNGTIISYLSHRVGRDALVIDCLRTEYQYFLAQLQDPALRLRVFPLTVAGAIIDERGNTLIGRRAPTVTEYPGAYEFVPSGSISADKIARGRVRFDQQLAEEFEEEVGLSPARIRAIEPFSLMLDVTHRLYVIGCTMALSGDLQVVRPRRREHDILHVIHRTALPRFLAGHQMIPTSRLIAQRLAR